MKAKKVFPNLEAVVEKVNPDEVKVGFFGGVKVKLQGNEEVSRSDLIKRTYGLYKKNINNPNFKKAVETIQAVESTAKRESDQLSPLRAFFRKVHVFASKIFGSERTLKKLESIYKKMASQPPLVQPDEYQQDPITITPPPSPNEDKAPPLQIHFDRASAVELIAKGPQKLKEFVSSKDYKENIDDHKAILTEVIAGMILSSLMDRQNPQKLNDCSSLAELVGIVGCFDVLDLSNLKNYLAHLTQSQKDDAEATLLPEWLKIVVGHEWGIDLKMDADGGAIETTGMYLEEAVMHYGLLVQNFMLHQAGTLDEPSKQKIIEAAFSAERALRNALKLNIYDFTQRAEMIALGRSIESDLKRNGIITLTPGWHRHGVGMTIHQAKDGKWFLYYCNRGAQAFEQAADRKLMGQQKNSHNMYCFEITNKNALTPELLGKIAATACMSREDQKQMVSSFIEGELFDTLGLKETAVIPKSRQKVGNCAWANCKGANHAAMIAAFYDQGMGFDEAIRQGTNLFKQIERDGRSESLTSLLAFDAQDPQSKISPTDHLRALSAALQKLRRKAKESYSFSNLLDIRNLNTLISWFANCQYPMSVLDLAGMVPMDKEQIEEKLRFAGAGSFLCYGQTCFLNNGNQVIEWRYDKNQTIQEFLKSCDPAKFPVFSDQPIEGFSRDRGVFVMNRLQAEQFLLAHQKKDYDPWLVRTQSDNPNQLVISRLQNGDFIHTQVDTHGKTIEVAIFDEINRANLPVSRKLSPSTTEKISWLLSAQRNTHLPMFSGIRKEKPYYTSFQSFRTEHNKVVSLMSKATNSIPGSKEYMEALEEAKKGCEGLFKACNKYLSERAQADPSPGSKDQANLMIMKEGYRLAFVMAMMDFELTRLSEPMDQEKVNAAEEKLAAAEQNWMKFL